MASLFVIGLAAMIPTSLGLVLIVPNVVALPRLAALLVGLERQVRVVEEPYLCRVHGADYERYANRVVRFVPRLGRVRSVGHRQPRRPSR